MLQDELRAAKDRFVALAREVDMNRNKPTMLTKHLDRRVFIAQKRRILLIAGKSVRMSKRVFGLISSLVEEW